MELADATVLKAVSFAVKFEEAMHLAPSACKHDVEDIRFEHLSQEEACGWEHMERSPSAYRPSQQVPALPFAARIKHISLMLTC